MSATRTDEATAAVGRGTLAVVPLWSNALRPGPCPTCDAPLRVELVPESQPTCPSCAQVLLPVKVAGFWRRLCAGLVDLAVLLLVALPLQAGVHWILRSSPPVDGDLSLDTALRWLALPPLTVAVWVLPAVGIAIAYAVIFIALQGATLGQRLMGVSIVSGTGTRPGFVRAIVRALGLVAGLAPGGLGSLWIAFDREKRGFHDHLAGTHAVRSR